MIARCADVVGTNILACWTCAAGSAARVCCATASAEVARDRAVLFARGRSLSAKLALGLSRFVLELAGNARQAGCLPYDILISPSGTVSAICCI